MTAKSSQARKSAPAGMGLWMGLMLTWLPACALAQEPPPPPPGAPGLQAPHGPGGPRMPSPRMDGPGMDGPGMDGPGMDGPRMGGPGMDAPGKPGPGPDGMHGPNPLFDLAKAEADQAASQAIADLSHAPLADTQRVIRTWGVPTALRYFDVEPETFHAAVTPRLLALVKAAVRDEAVSQPEADRIAARLQHQGPPPPPPPPRP